MGAITLYTWGYWGWGEATPQLVEAVDATEKCRDRNPLYFIDIRYQRTGRASGFVGNAFQDTVGKSRYRWEQRLGNPDISSAGPVITQKDREEAANELLDEAVKRHKDDQRVLFYCACVFPQWYRYPNENGRSHCHRDGVAQLLYDIAGERGLDIEVVEWPGFEGDDRIDLEVTPGGFPKVRKTLALNEKQLERPGLGYFASLPWGTVATVGCGHESIAVMTGPAQFKRHMWVLPILKRANKPDELAQAVATFRKDAGLNPRRTMKNRTKPAHGRRASKPTSSPSEMAQDIWTLLAAGIAGPDASAKKKPR